MQWPNATASADAEGMSAGLAESGGLQLNGMDLPCTEDPELFFAESPQDVESAKALCRGCAARPACLSGAIERREPWGVSCRERSCRASGRGAGPARPRWPLRSTGTSGRTTATTSRVADSMYLTEQMATERHRSLLREASGTRYARQARALHRATRRAQRAERRALSARRTEARLRSALQV
jgi:hypothetical protein